MNKYAIFLIITGMAMSCQHKTNNYEDSKMENVIENRIENVVFVEKIDSISTRVVDLTNHRDLLRIPAFMDIYENPKIFKDNALHVLSSSNTDEQLKEIAIWSMQKLDLDSYISFAQESFLLFKKDIISERCFMYVITTPDFDDKPILFRNYRNKKVKKFLNQIKVCDKLSLESKDVIRTMSGVYWRIITKYL